MLYLSITSGYSLLLFSNYHDVISVSPHADARLIAPPKMRLPPRPPCPTLHGTEREIVLTFGQEPVHLYSWILRTLYLFQPSLRLPVRLTRRPGNPDGFQSICPVCFRRMVLMSGVGRPSTCHVKDAPSAVRHQSKRANISVCCYSFPRTSPPSRWGWRQCDGLRMSSSVWSLLRSNHAMRPAYRTSSLSLARSGSQRRTQYGHFNCG